MSSPPTRRAAPAPSKAALRAEFVRALTVDLAARERSHRAAKEAATHEEAKPENDKDTRAVELSYLARGEAIRIEELRSALARVKAMPVRPFDSDEPVGLGALVATEEAGWIWVAPHGGGTRLAGGTVQVVTPRSPLGQALIGKRRGDSCEVALTGRIRVLVIVSVE
jgi:transcription elongation GreA/GreB family factor